MADAPEGGETVVAEGGEAEAEPALPAKVAPPSALDNSFELEPDITYPAGCDPQEILSEAFENILRLGKAYLRTLIRPKDIEVAGDIIRICEKINDTSDLKAKIYNITFTKYLVKILRWSSLNQPAGLYHRWYTAAPPKEQNDALTESRTWLEKDKSYISLKSFEDGTTLLYAAVATNPAAGWQDGGLKLLEERSLCPLL